MTSIQGIRVARIAGLLAGIVLAAALVLLSRPASGEEAVGAEVSFSAAQTGELAITPASPSTFARNRALQVGEDAGGNFELTNQTGEALAVRLRPQPSDKALDQALALTLANGDRVLASGMLGQLRAQGSDPIMLAPGESAAVSVQASLSGEPSENAAALVDVAMAFDLGTAAGATPKKAKEGKR